MNIKYTIVLLLSCVASFGAITSAPSFPPSGIDIKGTTDLGTSQALKSTGEGHLEVAIHSPALPFGSIHAEALTPIFQVDGVYGLNLSQLSTSLTVNGAVTVATNMMTCNSGSGTIGGSATLQTRKRLRYRPGQGAVLRFTGLFESGIANNTQIIGCGTAESGFYFGYNGTNFGVLHVTDGVREIQTMTITTASTATNVYVVTLPNSAGTVNVTATANGTTAQTAREIAAGSYPGWQAEAIDSTVVFLSGSAGNASGTFSLAQTGAGAPAAGSTVETTAGATATSNWTYQSDWNGDTCDGNGPSGFTLDPTKGNVFEVNIQYLGFGSVSMMIEATFESSNNHEFIAVHTFKFPNTRTSPHAKQPSFPFTMSSYNQGTAASSRTVRSGSCAGFVEGQKTLNGPRLSYNNSATSTTSAYTPLFTIRNDLIYFSRPNQSVINILGVVGAAKSNTGITSFYLVRNASLTGPTSWAAYQTGTSVAYFDTGSTACTFNNGDLIFTGIVPESGNFETQFADGGILLQPGETATLCVRSVTATATAVGSINTREDQ